MAAVYGFRDQTGQYKPSKGISYSTAVTQGATSILIESLLDSDWFITVDRANISNLLNERRIIRTIRKQNKVKGNLEPLLFAGVLLEGGIISYEANIITGGGGVRFLGMGVSGQFRKDQVTIYLRAVSTQTGRILLSVHTTKAIISKKLHGGVFRFVGPSRLLEAEVGYTYNEPSSMAVTAAIDAAVRRLIVKGVEKGIWQPASAQAFASYKETHQFGIQLNKQSSYADIYGLTHQPSLRSGLILSANLTYGSYIGNYNNEIASLGVLVGVEKFLSPTFSLKLDYQRTVIGAEDVFSTPVNFVDLMANAYLMPDLKLSPYLSAGAGMGFFDETTAGTVSQIFPVLTAEAGLDYRFNDWLGIRVGVNYRYLLDGSLDGAVPGGTNDQQWSIFAGFTFF